MKILQELRVRKQEFADVRAELENKALVDH